LEARLTDFTENRLLKMQSRLAAEAADYMKRVLAEKTEPCRVNRIIFSLTGIEPISRDNEVRAAKRLQTLLARQRRYSRYRSVKYDLDLHIALSQAANAMASMADECGAADG